MTVPPSAAGRYLPIARAAHYLPRGETPRRYEAVTEPAGRKRYPVRMERTTGQLQILVAMFGAVLFLGASGPADAAAPPAAEPPKDAPKDAPAKGVDESAPAIVWEKVEQNLRVLVERRRAGLSYDDLTSGAYRPMIFSRPGGESAVLWISGDSKLSPSSQEAIRKAATEAGGKSLPGVGFSAHVEIPLIGLEAFLAQVTPRAEVRKGGVSLDNLLSSALSPPPPDLPPGTEKATGSEAAAKSVTPKGSAPVPAFAGDAPKAGDLQIVLETDKDEPRRIKIAVRNLSSRRFVLQSTCLPAWATETWFVLSVNGQRVGRSQNIAGSSKKTDERAIPPQSTTAWDEFSLLELGRVERKPARRRGFTHEYVPAFSAPGRYALTVQFSGWWGEALAKVSAECAVDWTPVATTKPPATSAEAGEPTRCQACAGLLATMGNPPTYGYAAGEGRCESCGAPAPFGSYKILRLCAPCARKQHQCDVCRKPLDGKPAAAPPIPSPHEEKGKAPPL